MTSISNSTAAFHQFFRDREANAAAPQAGDGEGPGKVASNATADQGDAAQASALTPTQVRDRLDALIAGQVATGKLTSDQGSALRQSLTRETAQDATATAAATSTSPGDGPPSQSRPSTADPDGSYKPSEVLAAFIQNLQSGQAGSASYGSTGTAPTKSANSRLLDFNT